MIITCHPCVDPSQSHCKYPASEIHQNQKNQQHRTWLQNAGQSQFHAKLVTDKNNSANFTELECFSPWIVVMDPHRFCVNQLNFEFQSDLKSLSLISSAFAARNCIMTNVRSLVIMEHPRCSNDWINPPPSTSFHNSSHERAHFLHINRKDKNFMEKRESRRPNYLMEILYHQTSKFCH